MAAASAVVIGAGPASAEGLGPSNCSISGPPGEFITFIVKTIGNGKDVHPGPFVAAAPRFDCNPTDQPQPPGLG
jgi:hypothetical protein